MTIKLQNERHFNDMILVLVALVGLLLVLFAAVLFGWGPFRNIDLFGTREKAINSYEECVAAGNPVMESYPEQCRTKDGRTFTRELTDEEKQSGGIDEEGTAGEPKKSFTTENSDYYGLSTDASCTADSDCVVSGCNAEICQGKNEESMVSICIAPEKATPSQAGYGCGCVASKCQWSK